MESLPLSDGLTEDDGEQEDVPVAVVAVVAETDMDVDRVVWFGDET